VLHLNSFVEIKKIKSKRSTHFVPFPLSTKRKFYLIARWVVDSVGEDRRKINFAIKLSEEILMIVLKKPCKSVLKKNLNFKQSIQNKSNIHFRW
jgi:ribosomal protein S7